MAQRTSGVYLSEFLVIPHVFDRCRYTVICMFACTIFFRAPILADSQSHIGVAGLSLALYQGLWAYDGFEAITLVTEEVKNPARALPVITCIAVPLVTSLYLVVNIAYFSGEIHNV